MNIDVKYAGLPIALIVDSQIQYDNLKLIHKDEKWLYKELKEKGITNITNVAFASVQEIDGSFAISLKNKNPLLAQGIFFILLPSLLPCLMEQDVSYDSS